MGIGFERFQHTAEAAVMAASVCVLGAAHGCAARMSENPIPIYLQHILDVITLITEILEVVEIEKG